MSAVKMVYMPEFVSQLGSSQSEEKQPDLTADPSRCQRDVRGNTRRKVRGGENRSLLKVKLPKNNKSPLTKKVTKVDKVQRRWMVEPDTNKTKTVSRGDAATDSDSVGEDVFSFSERPTSTALNEKEKAKLAVLRTISKMLEENQLIRQKLSAISQAN